MYVIENSILIFYFKSIHIEIKRQSIFKNTYRIIPYLYSSLHIYIMYNAKNKIVLIYKCIYVFYLLQVVLRYAYSAIYVLHLNYAMKDQKKRRPEETPPTTEQL